jgi:beta-lactam-binding protein with PASTA domain
VPAGGSATLTYIYSFGTTIEGVRAMALAAQDQLKSPSISITSPANNTKVKTGAVAVSGTATAGSGIKSLTVAGHAVSVGPTGAWSTTVPLGKGANTITATATSKAGQTAAASITVIYAQTCTVPHVKGLSVSKAENRIRAAGCLVGKIKKKHSKVKKGKAAGTKPGAGSTVAAGTKIKLIVSKGP